MIVRAMNRRARFLRLLGVTRNGSLPLAILSLIVEYPSLLLIGRKGLRLCLRESECWGYFICLSNPLNKPLERGGFIGNGRPFVLKGH